MKRIYGTTAVILVTVSVFFATLVAAAPDAWSQVEVRGGTASFDAATTVPSINVRGRSVGLEARASLRDGSDGLALESVEASLPVRSLATGMGVRDEHMRRLVFTNPDGTMPNVTFVSRDAACAPETEKRQAACIVSGELAIRGIPRPFTMTVVVSRSGSAFRAAGDGVLKLSAYGIEAPTQFGVRVSDDVKLHLDFTARPTAAATALPGAAR
jgi:polyisoprenoid-binding protein YceI